MAYDVERDRICNLVGNVELEASFYFRDVRII